MLLPASKYGITLSQYLIEEQRKHPSATGELTLLINDIGLACKSIAAEVKRGDLADVLGDAGSDNVQGEQQKKLDIIANQIFLRSNIWRGHVAAMASEEMETIYQLPNEYPRGKYLLTFDPLDGSSNIDINGSIGTIFSIMRAPHGDKPRESDFLQSGDKQICAGYCLYGSSTMLVFSIGRGVHGFTLEPSIGEFLLTHPDMKIPEDTSEYAINHTNRLLWEAPVRRFIEEHELGAAGPFGKKYTMRWVGAMVADVHRILIRGGLFAYPMDEACRSKGGRLRLMYEAIPIAFLVEQAGGIASTGYERILDIEPQHLHQRVPVILGSKNEVQCLLDYHKLDQ